MQKRYLLVGCVILMLTTVFACLLMPGEICHIRYGRPLLSFAEGRDCHRRVKQGMTFNEVRTTLGDPHEIQMKGDGSIYWLYYARSTLSPFIDACVCIDFDHEGRVTRANPDH